MPKPPTHKRSLGARLNAALGQLLLLANAGAVDFSKGGLGTSVSIGSGGHGTHGERGKAPADYQPLLNEWVAFFQRAVDMAELDAAQERGEVPRPTEVRQGRVSKSDSRRRRQRIERERLYRGRRPEFVAYVEGCSVSLVREVRELANLDPLTGEPVPTLTSRKLPEVSS